MDKIYVVMMEEKCGDWEEPCITPIFASLFESICNAVIDRLEREYADDEVWHIHRSYYIDKIPVGNELITAGMFVTKFTEGNKR